MKQYVYEVLQEASKKTSETDKVKVLRDNESWALKDILRGTLDSTVEWNLPEGEPPYTKSDGQIMPLIFSEQIHSLNISRRMDQDLKCLQLNVKKFSSV